MATEIEYALMAGAAYISTRPNDVNKFPVPQGWTAFNHRSLDSGFEAVSFRKGNQIVISFAGTDPDDVSGDKVTCFNLGTGLFESTQLKQAAGLRRCWECSSTFRRSPLTRHRFGPARKVPCVMPLKNI